MDQSCMYRVGVKAVIHDKDGKLLLTYEDRKQSWDLPEGGLEAGHSIREGLIDEIYEELGDTIGDIYIDEDPLHAWPCIFDNGFGAFLIAYRVTLDITRIVATPENQKRKFFSQQEVESMQLYTKLDDVHKLFV